jgi:large subunit ribosomal protein L17
MRHRKGFNHLSRKKGHRKAMLANMASSLILHKRIKTTTAKAKALRMFVEPLITKSKNDSTHTRRVVFSHLQNKEAVSELFREVSPKIIDRPGGYTRILKTGFRLGDNADMCIIELVDYNENLLAAKSEAITKLGKRRRRGARKKAIVEGQVEDTAVAATEEMSKEAEIQEIKPDAGEKPEDLQRPLSEEKASIADDNIKKEATEEIADEVKESIHEKPDVAEEKQEEQEVKDEKQEVKEEGQEAKDKEKEEKEE